MYTIRHTCDVVGYTARVQLPAVDSPSKYWKRTTRLWPAAGALNINTTVSAHSRRTTATAIFSDSLCRLALYALACSSPPQRPPTAATDPALVGVDRRRNADLCARQIEFLSAAELFSRAGVIKTTKCNGELPGPVTRHASR